MKQEYVLNVEVNKVHKAAEEYLGGKKNICIYIIYIC